MVLVEVIQLIVDVNGLLDDTLGLHVASNKRHYTVFIILKVRLAILEVVVLHGDLVNLIGKHVEDNTGSEEQEAERQECEHSAHGRGHGSPGGQRLLLELGLLQFLNSVANVTLIFLVDIHFYCILIYK